MIPLEHPLRGTKIGLFGKGGSGKSTLAVLLARALCRRYTVCLLDADSTNAGTDRALGLDSPPEPLLDYFGGAVFSGGSVTCPVDDPTVLERARLVLDSLPDRYLARSDDGIILMTAGKIGKLGIGAGCDGPVAKIARDLQLRSSKGSEPVVLVDLKAGFEDTARGVITGLDWVLAVVDPTIAAIEAVSDLRRSLVQLRAGARPATAHHTDPELAGLAGRLFRDARVRGLLVVLNRVPDQDTERHLRHSLAERDVVPVAAIDRDETIARAWLHGKRLPTHVATERIDVLVRALEAAERTHRLPAARWSSFGWNAPLRDSPAALVMSRERAGGPDRHTGGGRKTTPRGEHRDATGKTEGEHDDQATHRSGHF
jgi:CO dehydrogenase nickel-insertion accessory protein CooC1